MPRIWDKQVIHSFFIPRWVNGKWYWLKRGIYILRRYERTCYGKGYDEWYSEQWVNIRLCTKYEYYRYKHYGQLPSNDKTK